MSATFWSFFTETNGHAQAPAISLRRVLRHFFRRPPVIAALVMFGLISLFTLFAPQLTRYTADLIEWDMAGDGIVSGRPPETGHWLGLDLLGRDIFARLVEAVRTSLSVGSLAVVVSSLAGLLLGAIGGCAGGILDRVMMRVTDTLNAIPAVLLVSAVLLLFGRSLDVLVISLGVVTCFGLARVVRARARVAGTEAYVDAALAGGARRIDIVVRHIFPNLLVPVVLHATLILPELIFLESLISFMVVCPLKSGPR